MVQPPIVELDAEMAASLGSLFQKARAEKLLAVQDVAKDLLLSKGQLLGLESGVAKSFYSVRIYVQAAKKYCAYLNLDFDAGQLLASPSALEQKSSVADTPAGGAVLRVPLPSIEASGGRYMRDARVWVGLATFSVLALLYATPIPVSDAVAILKRASGGIIATLDGAGRVPEVSGGASLVSVARETSVESWSGQSEQGRIAKETQVVVEKQVDPLAGKDERKPEQHGVSTSVKLGSGGLRLVFAKPSWVEVVYSHSPAIRQTFLPGQELALEYPDLKSVLIGNYAGVKVYQRERPLDTEAIRKSSGNVVRFSGEELAQLMR